MKRAPPIRKKREDGSAICWYTMLWAGHCGHLVGLWSSPVWPAPRLRACCLYYISSSGFVLVAGKWPHLQSQYQSSPPLLDKVLSDQSPYLCAQGQVWWELDAAVLWMLKNLVPYALRHSKELPTQEAPSPMEISILSQAASFIFSIIQVRYFIMTSHSLLLTCIGNFQPLPCSPVSFSYQT